MKIFIVHYKKLTERKDYLLSTLKGYDVEFVDEFDRDDFNMGNIIYDENLWRDRINSIKTERYNPTFEKLKNSEICNSLSHIKCYEKIVQENLDYALILEDDVILTDDFYFQLEKIISKVSDFDFIFLGNSYTMSLLDDIHNSKSIKIFDRLYYKDPGHTRTVDSYLISKECAKNNRRT